MSFIDIRDVSVCKEDSEITSEDLASGNFVEALEWLKENHPENGQFKAYWTKNNGLSFQDEGYGPRYEWNYKDGKKDGVSKGWFPSGQLKRQVSWKDGKIHGKWTRWNPDGKKHREMNYRDGAVNGKNTQWWENGNKQVEQYFIEAKRHGLETHWYENGQMKLKETYKMGKRVTFDSWDRSGNILVKDGTGKWIEWWDRVWNGHIIPNDFEAKSTEGFYQDGKREGVWTGWYRFGREYMKGEYKDDQKNGLWTIWYNENDSYSHTQKFEEINYKNGIRDGEYKRWYYDGATWILGTYKDGKSVGKWYEYEESGGKIITRKSTLTRVERVKQVLEYDEL